MSNSKPLAVTAACAAFVLLAITAAGAASIPAWLDEGISTYNTAHPAAKIRFVDIKDSFVWYDMPKASDQQHQELRDAVNTIVQKNGYEPMDDEELVTAAKPPAPGGRTAAKKCWSRSFVLNIKAQSDTKAVDGESGGQRQRMLTSMVCEDTATWWAGFRIAG